LPPVPGFAFTSSARILTDYALCVSYVLPPLAVYWRLSLLSRLRCQAHKKLYLMSLDIVRYSLNNFLFPS